MYGGCQKSFNPTVKKLMYQFKIILFFNKFSFNINTLIPMMLQNYYPIPVIVLWKSAKSPLFDMKRFPLTNFFRFKNRWKSEGAKSSKEAECSSNLYFKPLIYPIATADLCIGALSWWNKVSFFANLIIFHESNWSSLFKSHAFTCYGVTFF